MLIEKVVAAIGIKSIFVKTLIKKKNKVVAASGASKRTGVARLTSPRADIRLSIVIYRRRELQYASVRLSAGEQPRDVGVTWFTRVSLSCNVARGFSLLRERERESGPLGFDGDGIGVFDPRDSARYVMHCYAGRNEACADRSAPNKPRIQIRYTPMYIARNP